MRTYQERCHETVNILILEVLMFSMRAAVERHAQKTVNYINILGLLPSLVTIFKSFCLQSDYANHKYHEIAILKQRIRTMEFKFNVSMSFKAIEQKP